MAGAGGSGGLKDINQQVDSNERKLFKVLHDKEITAEDKLQQMREVYDGGNVNINFQYECDGNNTLLHGAVTQGFVNVVAELLRNKADVNLKNIEGDTSLHIAVSQGFLDVIKSLLEYKADVNLKNEKGEAPLHIAASRGFGGAVELLLGVVETDVNLNNAEGKAPLHIAVSHGFVGVVKRLLEYKADVNLMNTEGAPLHIAVSQGFVDVVESLLEYKADVNLKNEKGEAPLHIAVYHGLVGVIERLLKYKANVNLENAEGDTPLHIAVSCGIVGIVKVLLKKKALDDMQNEVDVNLKNAKGDAPLHLVLNVKNKIQKTIIHLLMQYKADVDIQNLAGDTLLHLAVRQETIEVIELLLKKKANAGIQNEARETPLSLAIDTKVADVFSKFSATHKPAGAKSSFHGTVYHLYLLMAFALRALFLGCAFMLGTEMKEAEQFDDILLRHDTKRGKRKTLFVQVKHKACAQNTINLNDLLAKGKKAEFSLLKYFKSFVKIKLAKGQEASKIDFAICTNTQFNFKDNEPGKLNCVQLNNDVEKRLEDLATILTLREIKKGTEKEDTYKEFLKDGKRFNLVTDFKTKKIVTFCEIKADTEKEDTNKDFFKDKKLYNLGTDPTTGKIVTFCEIQADTEKEDTSKEFHKDGKTYNLVTDPTTEKVVSFCKIKTEKDTYNKFFQDSKRYNLVTDDKTVELLRKYFYTEYEAELNGKSNSNDGTENNNETNPEGLKPEENDGKNTAELNGKSNSNDGTEHYNVTNPEGLKPEENDGKNTAELNGKSNSNDGTENNNETNPEGLKPEENGGKNKGANEPNVLLTHLNDGVSLRHFLTKLIFVVNQKADHTIVKCEIEQHNESKNLNTDLFTEAFHYKIYRWYSDIQEKWLKNETVKEMVESIKRAFNTFAFSWLTRVHAKNLLTSPIKFNDVKLVELNEHLNKYRFVHVVTTMEPKLTLIQVAQAISDSNYEQDDSYMFMRVSSLLPCGDEERTLNAFESYGKHDLLVIDCLSLTETVSERELKTLGKKLLKITKKNNKKKVVIIAPDNHMLADMFSSYSGYYKHTVTNAWKDFKSETQDLFLTKQVDFQGQLVELNQVIKKTEKELLELVPLETLIGDEKLVIGTGVLTSIGYNKDLYIDRSVNFITQIVLRTDLLVKDISTSKFEEKLAFTESQFKNLCNEDPKANIHWIQEQGDKFTWVKSQGEFEALWPYIHDKTNRQSGSWSEEEFLNSVKLQRVVILSDLAGMGKSTVLTHLSNKVKAKKDGTLVFRIDLNNHTKLFKSEKKIQTIDVNCKALDFLYDEIIKIKKTDLDEALFKLKGKVILMFDGFDEISAEYEETVLGLIQNLKRDTEAQIWITTRPFIKEKEQNWNTTRPVMNEKLEDTFRVWSYSLQPISEPNQADFLFNYWKQTKKNIKDSDKDIQDFASRLLSQFSKSIRDKEREFVGIPLQLKMLAECFGNDSMKSFDVVKRLSLVDLYDTFIQKKFEIYQIEKNENDVSKTGAEQDLEDVCGLYIKRHQWLALSVLLTEETSAALLLPGYKRVNDLVKYIPNINKIGIVSVTNGNPHFIHRTFAEYCVAEYFMDLLECQTFMSPKVQSFIRSKLLINDNFAGIRCFLNGLLAKRQPATHTLSEFQDPLLTGELINNKFQDMKILFLRTATEFNDHIFLYLMNGADGKDERVFKMMRKSTAIINKTMLERAVGNNDVKFLRALLNWTRDNMNQRESIPELMKIAICNEDDTSLGVESEKGRAELVLILLDWTHHNLGGVQGIVKWVYAESDRKGMSLLHLASAIGRIVVVQALLQWTSKNVDNDQKTVKWMLKKCDSTGSTSLHLASAVGRHEVVRAILQWTRENLNDYQKTVKWILRECDSEGIIPLHKALLQGHSDVVKTLLQWARKNLNDDQNTVKLMLNARDSYGNTSLHCAVGTGQSDVVQKLLQWTRDKLDDNGDTVKWMLKEGDSGGITSLHRALAEGHSDVVQKLLEWTRDKLDDERRTVKLMLKARDKNKNTSLHWAFRSGHNDVVQVLLQWTRDELDDERETVKWLLKKCDNDGNTPLQCAFAQGHKDVAQGLLQWTRDNLDGGQEIVKWWLLEARDNDGFTLLNKITYKGLSDMVQTLLHWTHDNLDAGPKIVEQMLKAGGKIGGTSLHWASFTGNSDMAQLLLKWTNDNLVGGSEIVKWMLKAGDINRNISLVWAVVQEHSDVQQVLLQWMRDCLG